MRVFAARHGRTTQAGKKSRRFTKVFGQLCRIYCHACISAAVVVCLFADYVGLDERASNYYLIVPREVVGVVLGCIFNGLIGRKIYMVWFIECNKCARGRCNIKKLYIYL